MAATKPSGATGPLKRVEALLTLLPTVRKELDLPSDDVIIRASGGKELDILVTVRAADRLWSRAGPPG